MERKTSAGPLKAASYGPFLMGYVTLEKITLFPPPPPPPPLPQVLFIFILSLRSLSPPRFSKIDRNYN